jgi:1-deoxy-D-xylulose-5-phosphate synthase
MKILDSITSPTDIRSLSHSQLEELAAEIRSFFIETVLQTGGHLASNLGAVELSLAVHRMFESPIDKIVWDVGHQSYTHKLLTGRKQMFDTLRQFGGLSGFPSREESGHDVFGVGHAGTSISAALGMALARDLNNENFNVVAIVGDGSLGSGMALEAMNHTGHIGTKVIVILNDNGMAISPSVGIIANLLNRVRFDPYYSHARRVAEEKLTHFHLGEVVWNLSEYVKSQCKTLLLPSGFWEKLGFTYLGPIDGHNIEAIESALERAKKFEAKPTLIHVLTKKGKGYHPAESDATRFHGISCKRTKEKSPVRSYTSVFSDAITRLMQADRSIVAITAAMLDGTGLESVEKQFPDRVFDVGICEQHAVTLAAGLATQGYRPVVAIYSSFLQRAYDQIIHDVCIQKLPVVFAVDRAGIVGEDGKTHQGCFDLSFLRCIPNTIIAAPKDENELANLLFTAVRQEKPMIVRYPKGCGEGVERQREVVELPIGKAELLCTGKDITIAAIGSTVYPAWRAVAILAAEGINCSLINIRYAKPLDHDVILKTVLQSERLVTVEENVLSGGVGSAILELLAQHNAFGVRTACIALPDEYIEHGTQSRLRNLYNIDTPGIVERIKQSFPELSTREKQGEKDTVHETT